MVDDVENSYVNFPWNSTGIMNETCLHKSASDNPKSMVYVNARIRIEMMHP